MSKTTPCCSVRLLYNLIKLVEEYSKLVSETNHNNLPSDKDQMPCELQLRDYGRWKRHPLKDCLQTK